MIDFSDFKSCELPLRHFVALTAIPRGSGNTKPIADYLVDFAKSRGLEHYRDEADNVIIKKPATEGMRGRPGIIFQGHTDIVAEKLADADIDMTKEGPRILRDGDFLRAEGTTLGGDDGVAMAYALAVLDSDDIEHPDFEAVFTSDEEIGLLGADALDASVLKGRTMINIDSDAEGVFTVGCAGGVRCDISLPVNYEFCEQPCAYEIQLKGLRGGHSGIEIDKGHANAVKVVAELLKEIPNVRIVSITGGNADNAIPRECTAEITGNEDLPDHLWPALRKRKEMLALASAVADGDKPVEGIVNQSLREAEPDMAFSLYRLCRPIAVMDENSTKALLSLLSELPSGVVAMNEELGMVQTSLNLGILRTHLDRVDLSFSVRSAVGEEKRALCQRLRAIAEKFGASYGERGEYPAWEYKKESHLRDVMCRVYSDMYGKAPEVVTIHAGLECGIFAGKMEGLDCVSIGPDNYDIHTPDERLSISSTARVWEFLKTILKNI